MLCRHVTLHYCIGYTTPKIDDIEVVAALTPVSFQTHLVHLVQVIAKWVNNAERKSNSQHINDFLVL